jgi:hypothetical protein
VLDAADELSLAAGISIPTGKVGPMETDQQETLQFGTGTFDPLARVRYTIVPAWWGFSAAQAGQASPYRNGYGYQGPAIGELSLGFRTRPTEWLGVDLTATGVARGHSSWDAEREAGYTSLLASLALHWTPAEWIVISTTGGYRIASSTSDGSVLPRPQFLAALRLTFSW